MVVIDVDALAALGEDDVECIGLAGEAYTLQAKVEAKLKDKREQKLESLTKEHEELKVQRREHAKVMNIIRNEEFDLRREKDGIDRGIQSANYALKLLRDNAPNPQFAPQAEIEEHNNRVAEAEQQKQKAIARRVANNTAFGEWEKRATAANETLAKLNKEIEAKWDLLEELRTGKRPRRVDGETGLVRGVHGSMFSS
jgi:hypothetical protein